MLNFYGQDATKTELPKLDKPPIEIYGNSLNVIRICLENGYKVIAADSGYLYRPDRMRKYLYQRSVVDNPDDDVKFEIENYKIVIYRKQGGIYTWLFQEDQFGKKKRSLYHANCNTQDEAELIAKQQLYLLEVLTHNEELVIHESPNGFILDIDGDRIEAVRDDDKPHSNTYNIFVYGRDDQKSIKHTHPGIFGREQAKRYVEGYSKQYLGDDFIFEEENHKIYRSLTAITPRINPTKEQDYLTYYERVPTDVLKYELTSPVQHHKPDNNPHSAYDTPDHCRPLSEV